LVQGAVSRHAGFLLSCVPQYRLLRADLQVKKHAAF
jgi:hypothetical protein